MKIYIVNLVEYDEVTVVGVFTDESLAYGLKDALTAKYGSGWRKHADVEEHDVLMAIPEVLP